MKKSLIRYGFICIFLIFLYSITLYEDIRQEFLSIDILLKIILYLLPIFFLIVHLLKSREKFTNSKISKELLTFQLNEQIDYDIISRFNKIKTNWDQYLSLILMCYPFLVFFLNLERTILLIISISLMGIFCSILTVVIVFFTIRAKIQKNRFIKELELKIGELLKKNENQVELSITELTFIIIQNSSVIDFPWISFISSVIPQILQYLFDFSFF